MQFCFNNNNFQRLDDCINMFLDKLDNDRKIVFLCIGTDKVIGDSFGPIVGHLLNEKYLNVFGTLKNTVNATNLSEILCNIKNKYNNPYIITIDSALGTSKIVNNIVVGKGGIIPGSALNKKFDSIGDMYINGIVAKVSDNNFRELKNVRMYDVFKLSNIVFNAINNVLCLEKVRYVNNHIS